MNTGNTNHSWLWERVQAAIDRREDPLDDWELAQELAKSPEVAAQVVQLLASLEQLAPARFSFVRPWGLSLGATAAILIAAFVLWQRLPVTHVADTSATHQTTTIAFRRGEPSVEFTALYTGLAGTTRVRRTNNIETSEFRPRAWSRWIPAETPGAIQPSPGDTLTYTHSIALPTLP